LKLERLERCFIS